MKVELKRYQEEAVNELLYKANLLLKKDSKEKTIVFQSPTGSGKTLTMCRFIDEFIQQDTNREVCFLWVSIGKGNLHIQSYKSLQKEFEYFPIVHLLENEFTGGREFIKSNEVVVVNWEKLRTKDRQTGEWTNVLMRDKETTNFRELVRDTKEMGILMVLIIDESHSNSTSERARELRSIINADITVEVSATPVLSDNQEKVIVEPQKVIEEGMIKKEIIINEHLDNIMKDEITSQDLIMEAAYFKRERLKNLYRKEGLDINPLVLIQLPTGEEADHKKERIEKFLGEKEISSDVRDGRLAIWLSEKKINTEYYNLIKNNSKVEFLIFKQAIDTGWDCPRASILVKLRESKSITFEIQTIGRILRMPEAEHYQNDELNKGYIFTNVEKFNVKKEEYNPNIIKSLISKRKDIYDKFPIKLRSYYRNRIDFGDLTFSFKQVLDKEFCKYFGITLDEYGPLFTKEIKVKIKRKIALDIDEYQDEIMLNKTLDTTIVDKIKNSSIYGEYDNLFGEKNLLKTNLAYEDKDEIFHALIRANLSGFAYKRSIGFFKNVLYSWFKRYLEIWHGENDITRIKNIVLNNATVFSSLFSTVTEKYKKVKEKEINNKIKEIEEWDERWEIAKERNFNAYTYKKENYKKSLYNHFNFDSEIEKGFAKYLDENENVLWWWQNGNEHMQLNFGIKYNTKSTFQPDFLVMFCNGNLGIFDTKSSNHLIGTKEKAEALQNYIEEEKKKEKKLFGGIIIKQGKNFKINTNKTYNEDENEILFF